MILLRNQHARARRDGEPLCCRRHAIGNRGDEGHVVCIGVDQAGGRLARALAFARRERLVDAPWPPFTGDTPAPRLLHCERQRAPCGGVEVADAARHIKQCSLRGQHRMPSSVSETYPQASSTQEQREPNSPLARQCACVLSRSGCRTSYSSSQTSTKFWPVK